MKKNLFSMTNALCTVFLVIFLFPSFAIAADTRTDAMLRTLNYVRALDSNNNNIIDVSIIYDSATQESQDQARAIKKHFLTKNILKSRNVNAQIVPIEKLNEAKESDVYFIVSGLKTHFDAIQENARKNKIFTLSNDIACAEQQCCAVVVDMKNSVQIYLNQAVLDVTGFDVDSNFRYLAKRI